jgi:L-fuculose-phosphate aldolase
MTSERELRQQMVDTMQAMERSGLNRGTSGNVSARLGDAMLVTPSGVTPDLLTPDSIVLVHGDGDGSTSGDALRPSSEWQMHHGLLKRRPDVDAVVHCHARYSTILACAHKTIPPIHYMVGVSGLKEVPLAPYATFGSRALADVVADNIGSGFACLMANHGLITLGPTLRRALAITDEIEQQAAVYYGTLAIGGPVLLDDRQMEEVFDAFRGYGQRRAAPKT